MRLSRKALARVVSGLLLLCATQSAVGSLYDGKYGQYATFDVWRTQVNCITQGAVNLCPVNIKSCVLPIFTVIQRSDG